MATAPKIARLTEKKLFCPTLGAAARPPGAVAAAPSPNLRSTYAYDRVGDCTDSARRYDRYTYTVTPLLEYIYHRTKRRRRTSSRLNQASTTDEITASSPVHGTPRHGSPAGGPCSLPAGRHTIFTRHPSRCDARYKPGAALAQRHTGLYTHPFNGPFSRTTQVSRYQKGKTSLDFTEARDSEWQRHQLGRMQDCTSLQTDNRASTPPLLVFYRPDALPAAQPPASKH